MMQDHESRRLSELTVADARRAIIYGAATLLALFLFFWLVGQVLVALLLGVVAGAYLLPVQMWLERRLKARAGSALITMGLIVVPLVVLVAYGWSELSGYSNLVFEKHEQIIAAISRSLSEYVAVERTRAGLETAFGEAVMRSGDAIQGLRKQMALLLASTTVFFFTMFYVITERARLANYVKVRIPGEFLPLYEKLCENVGGALRGALMAVMIDQSLKGIAIVLMNLAFGVPLAVVLGLVTFLVGFFPLLGEWAVYIPIGIYLLVFQHRPRAALAYLLIGVAMTICSSLLLRPKLAARGAKTFNFYWMLLALVSGVFAFGIPGIVLGPAILGFAKAVADTLVGQVRYETSLLKEERAQVQEGAAGEVEDELDLTGRPSEAASADDVQVEMKD
ncbi:MAG: AI-2E family transporter [Pyrinomonadaceae bacterium]